MSARRRRPAQRSGAYSELMGRLTVQAMLIIAFSLNVYIAVAFHRGVIEVLIAMFGIVIGLFGGLDVIKDHRSNATLRVRLASEATRANYAEAEVNRLKSYFSHPGTAMRR